MGREGSKTKAQLVGEIRELRKRISELKASSLKQRKTEVGPEKGEQSCPGITDLRHIGDSQRDCEEALRAVLESTADGILAVDEKGQVILANRRFARIWRIPQDLFEDGSDQELLDFVLEQLAEPDVFLARVKELYQSTHESFDTVHFLDGRILERYSRPLFRNDTLAGRVWSFRDVTERYRAEEALREEHQFREEVISGAGQGIAVCDKKLRLLLWNAFLERETGVSAAEVVGKPLLELFPFLREQGIDRLLKSALTGKTAASGDFSYTIPKSGVSGWAEMTCAPHRNAAGEIVAVIAMVRDVTERRRMEESLRSLNATLEQRVKERTVAITTTNKQLQAEIGMRVQIEQRLSESLELNQALIGASSLGVAAYMASGKCILANEAMGRILGTASEELMKQNFRRTAYWRKSGLLHLAEETLAGTEPRSAEFRLATGVGKEIWLDTHLAPFISGGKKHLLLMVNDITRRKLTEEALQERDELNRTILCTAIDGFLLVDAQGRIWDANDAYCRMSGYDLEELRALSVGDLEVKESPEETRLHMQEVARTGSDRFETRHRRKDGQTIDLDVSVTFLPKPYRFFAFARDITERLRSDRIIAEQRLKMINSARLSALGIMAASVAHEINNPLAVISVGLQHLQALSRTQEPGPAQMDKIADAISRNIDRVARIIQSLRSLAREGSGDAFKRVSVNNIIRDTLELCQERFRTHGIDIVIPDIPEHTQIECRASQLSQVLLNLLNNAYDATVNLPDRWVRLDMQDNGSTLELSVTDSGHGLPDDIAESVFIPFFTKKKESAGMGLGLSISKSLIEDHNGEIGVDRSCPNTRFFIRLPKQQDPRRPENA
jgi:PAS domain S-box-containing protein